MLDTSLFLNKIHRVGTKNIASYNFYETDVRIVYYITQVAKEVVYVEIEVVELHDLFLGEYKMMQYKMMDLVMEGHTTFVRNIKNTVESAIYRKTRNFLGDINFPHFVIIRVK